MDQTHYFIVLTGGPGVGKTTLLKELHKQGFNIVEEDARRIIREQLETGADAVPWKNKIRYAELMLAASTASYLIQVGQDHKRYVFFDRGIPDSLAYITMEDLAIEEELIREAKSRRYHKKVFILPPWAEIYANDNERKQTWQEAENTFKIMKETYTKLGYETIVVPKTTVFDRAQFILKALDQQNY
ncbi:MAG: AAA family ATPase [Sphingobacterium sp.]